MKDIFGQMLGDFEDGMKEVREEAIKYNVETSKALSRLEVKVDKLTSRPKQRVQSKVGPPSAPPASSGTPKQSSSSTSAANAHINKDKRKQKRKTDYQCKPRVLFIGDSLAHNTNFNKLEVVTNTTIKTAKA